MCLFIEYCSCFIDNSYSFPSNGIFLMFLLFPIFTSSKFLFTLHLFWCLLFMLETLLQCLIILGCPFVFKSEILEWYWMLCVDSLNLWKDRFENRVINKVPQMCCRAFPPPNVSMQKYFFRGTANLREESSGSPAQSCQHPGKQAE